MSRIVTILLAVVVIGGGILWYARRQAPAPSAAPAGSPAPAGSAGGNPAPPSTAALPSCSQLLSAADVSAIVGQSFGEGQLSTGGVLQHDCLYHSTANFFSAVSVSFDVSSGDMASAKRLWLGDNPTPASGIPDSAFSHNNGLTSTTFLYGRYVIEVATPNRVTAKNLEIAQKVYANLKSL